jgi:hypothetical protein
MPKKVILSAAAVAALTIGSAASLFLGVGAAEQSITLKRPVYTIDLDRKLREYREMTVDDPI